MFKFNVTLQDKKQYSYSQEQYKFNFNVKHVKLQNKNIIRTVKDICLISMLNCRTKTIFVQLRTIYV